MKSEILSRFDQMYLPLSVLVLFFSIFCIMIFYISKKSTGSKFKTTETLPLDEAPKISNGDNNER